MDFMDFMDFNLHIMYTPILGVKAQLSTKTTPGCVTPFHRILSDY